MSANAPTAAPPADAFPAWPVGWCAAARSADVRADRPVGVDLFGRRIALFRRPDGTAAALDARCWHLGADLSAGDVVDGCVRCPFHGWQFDAAGRCTRGGPPHAHQRAFATAERAGRVWVFPGDAPTHPLPSFDGADPRDLIAARPFGFRVGCPWWLVGTNGFDAQHFAHAHDRRLVGPPEVSTPHPAARRIVATFEVVGDGWRDRLTRRAAGPFVTMHVTVWAGSLAFVIATFRRRPGAEPRTATYGLTEVVPTPDGRGSLVRVTIHRRRRGLGPADAADVAARAAFVRAFLAPDARLLDGARYRPERLTPADATMADYLRWLADASWPGPAPTEETPPCA